MPKQKLKTQEIILPENVRKAYQANFGSDVNYRLGVEFELSISQLVELTELVRDLYYKKVDVLNIEAEISKRLWPLDATPAFVKTSAGKRDDIEKVSELAKELCGMRLLVVGDEWFEGKPAKKIIELGGRVEDYAEFVEKYKEDMDKEEMERLSEVGSLGAASAYPRTAIRGSADERDDIGETIKEKLTEEPLVVKDPAQERANAKIVFGSMLKKILGLRDYALKIELNVRLITLLMSDDEERVFQRELIDLMHENNELITKEPILINNENIDPTISNWIKDYVSYAGSGEALSSIKKAQYFTASPNLKKASAEEREMVDKVLKLYFAVKNFYFSLSKYDLSDIYIFPFSDDEQSDFIEDLKAQNAVPEQTASELPPDQSARAIDIAELFKDNAGDRQKINQEKERIANSTRKEYNKVADEFELALLNRKKHIIIACIEILAEIGALDNLLVEDNRFQNLLFGYFKRNNLQSEQAAFKADPYKGKYVQAFVRFIFIERLGLSDNEGARLAANLSNIFRSRGVKEYGQLAFLDLSDNKFKWTEL